MSEYKTMAEYFCYVPRLFVKAFCTGNTNEAVVSQLETARMIVHFDSTNDQNKLDAISHANESLYLIRSGTA